MTIATAVVMAVVINIPLYMVSRTNILRATVQSEVHEFKNRSKEYDYGNLIAVNLNIRNFNGTQKRFKDLTFYKMTPEVRKEFNSFLDECGYSSLDEYKLWAKNAIENCTYLINCNNSDHLKKQFRDFFNYSESTQPFPMIYCLIYYDWQQRYKTEWNETIDYQKLPLIFKRTLFNRIADTITATKTRLERKLKSKNSRFDYTFLAAVNLNIRNFNGPQIRFKGLTFYKMTPEVRKEFNSFLDECGYSSLDEYKLWAKNAIENCTYLINCNDKDHLKKTIS